MNHDTPTACPTCKRPYPKDAPKARAGHHPGVENEAAALSEPSHRSQCGLVLRYLRAQSGRWVSAYELRDRFLGDPTRRVRQLRDEFGQPIEVEMRTGPRQAWYRLDTTAIRDEDL